MLRVILLLSLLIAAGCQIALDGDAPNQRKGGNARNADAIKRQHIKQKRQNLRAQHAADGASLLGMSMGGGKRAFADLANSSHIELISKVNQEEFNSHLSSIGCKNGVSSILPIYSLNEEKMKLRYLWSKDVFVKTPDFNSRVKRRDLIDILGPISAECKGGLDTLGGQVEGGKRACGLLSKTLNDASKGATVDGSSSSSGGSNSIKGLQQSAKGGPCVIISIGSYNSWLFEEAVFNSTSCVVHTFDCMIEHMGGVRVPAAISSRVFGYNVCLASVDKVENGREFRSWNSLIEMTKITSVATYLKMDIEGYEWRVLTDMINGAAESNTLPLQIAFELHYGFPLNPELQFIPKEVKPMIKWAQHLYLKGGYSAIDRWDNNEYCFYCTEILMARICKS